MGKKKKEITCTFILNGQEVDELPQDVLDAMSTRLSKTMSEYYTKHPDEYKAYIGGKQ